MAMTAVDAGSDEPPATPGCWCCGDRTCAEAVRLGEHPEVGVCFRCVRVLARRKRDIQRRTRAAPSAWPLWRRVQYRAGFGRCWHEDRVRRLRVSGRPWGHLATVRTAPCLLLRWSRGPWAV